MNSAYNYDPVSRKDDLVDIVAHVLDVIVPVLRPDVAVVVDAFPWGGLLNFIYYLTSVRDTYVCSQCSVSPRGFPGCRSRGIW